MKKLYSKKLGGEAFAIDAAQLDTLKKAGYTVPSPEEVIINADGGISLVVVCIIGEIIELAVLLDFAENILTIAPYAVVVVECHADELKRNIVAICVEPLSALATVAGDLSTNGLGFLAFGSLGLPAGG